MRAFSVYELMCNVIARGGGGDLVINIIRTYTVDPLQTNALRLDVRFDNGFWQYYYHLFMYANGYPF